MAIAMRTTRSAGSRAASIASPRASWRCTREHPTPRLIARSVVQRGNFASLASDDRRRASHGIRRDLVSRRRRVVIGVQSARAVDARIAIAEVTVGERGSAGLEASIDARRVDVAPDLFHNGFVAGGRASLDRILQYYTALAGRAAFPAVQCNAPWVSAVLEPDGSVRPCFFHPAYGSGGRRSRGRAELAAGDRVQAIAWRRAQCRSAGDACAA